MVDVARMPDNSFGMVPTPAIVAPLEFSMRFDEYRDLGGHLEYVRDVEAVLAEGAWHHEGAPQGLKMAGHPEPVNPWPIGRPPILG
jgi:hypothetical protein